MGTKQTMYSEEFKSMIVELYRKGKTASEIMSEYGLSKTALYKWVNEGKEIKVDDEQVSAAEICSSFTLIATGSIPRSLLRGRFIKLFKRIVGRTPSHYRKQFKG